MWDPQLPALVRGVLVWNWTCSAKTDFMGHGKSQLDFAGGAEGEQEEVTSRNPCPGFSPALSTNCGISKAEFGCLMNWFGGNYFCPFIGAQQFHFFVTE